MQVLDLKIREIYATTSIKTVEVELHTRKGVCRASVPQGTSVGKYEAISLPMEEVVRNFVMLRGHFVNKFFSSQTEVDETLKLANGTPRFGKIGGNLALAISAAFLKGFALEEGVEVYELLSKQKPCIPRPLCNLIGGWKGQSDVQEFLLFPLHQESFKQSISVLAQIYAELGNKLATIDPGFRYGKNIESAWISTLPTEKILELLSPYAEKGMLRIGLDLAASGHWNGEHYVYPSGKRLSRPQQLNWMRELARSYPIAYFEDPFHQDDFHAFSVLTLELSPKLVCGDDLYATNVERLKEGILHRATNALVIKPNQAGTISDVIRVVELAKKEKMAIVFSHRSGETEDTLICHLAVGLGADYVKFGIAGERVVKINEMLRIEEKLLA